MKDPKSLIDCSVLTLTIFLALPILFIGLQGAGIESIGLMAITLYIINPLVCLSCGVFCGVKNGFLVYYPLLAGILFLPSMFLFFNWSAWVFPLIYIVLALLGVAVGAFYKNNTSGRRRNGRLR